jgi:SET domain-containing protein
MTRGIMPHKHTLVRLKPSKIHGVGVFAIKRISKGDLIFPDDDGEMTWVNKKLIDKLPAAIKRLYIDFCVYEGDRVLCPSSFNRMTISWFLNHSDNPNVACDENYCFTALRDIEVDEELTANYKEYSDIPEELVLSEGTN